MNGEGLPKPLIPKPFYFLENGGLVRAFRQPRPKGSGEQETAVSGIDLRRRENKILGILEVGGNSRQKVTNPTKSYVWRRRSEKEMRLLYGTVTKFGWI